MKTNKQIKKNKKTSHIHHSNCVGALGTRAAGCRWGMALLTSLPNVHESQSRVARRPSAAIKQKMEMKNAAIKWFDFCSTLLSSFLPTPLFGHTHTHKHTHTKTHTNRERVALCKRCDARAKGHALAYIDTRHSIDFLYCTSRLIYPAWGFRMQNPCNT